MKYKAAQKPIVYIDESGFADDMPRTHGYSTKGDRCYGKKDWNAKGRTNVIGAQLGGELVSLGLFNCNIDSEVFHSWVESQLLKQIPEESVVVMDNATFHKRKDTQQAIRKAGHILEYMPAYSPDLNPIEHKWAQAKSIRRKYQCDINSLFTNYSI